MMNAVISQLIARNDEFVEHGFVEGLKMMPSLKTTIIGCVDPRVDPAELFGLQLGEAVIIRNVGGRVFPSTFQTLRMLGVVAKTQGGAIGAGWNLIVLHHTDCGINCLTSEPQLLAKHFEVSSEDLDGLAVSDPQLSVSVDVAALKANSQFAGGVGGHRHGLRRRVRGDLHRRPAQPSSRRWNVILTTSAWPSTNSTGSRRWSDGI